MLLLKECHIIEIEGIVTDMIDNIVTEAIEAVEEIEVVDVIGKRESNKPKVAEMHVKCALLAEEAIMSVVMMPVVNAICALVHTIHIMLLPIIQEFTVMGMEQQKIGRQTMDLYQAVDITIILPRRV